MPTPKRLPEAAPMPSDASILTALGLGAVGGVFVAKVMFEQMFVRGLSREEKRGAMLGISTALSLLAAKHFFGIDEDTISQKFDEIVGE